MKTLKKRNILSASLAALAAVLLCVVAVFAAGFGKDNASANWTNEGGVDHYTDMSSDGADLEYYDVLYNYNWFICDDDSWDSTYYNANKVLKYVNKLSDDWEIKNYALLRFIPSTKNTTASFVWKFNYTPTTVAASGMNIYPLSAKGWAGAQQIDIASHFTEAGKTYAVELGVVKVKNNTQYYVFLKVDNEFKIGTYRTRATVSNYGVDSDYTGLYFYLTAGAGTVGVPQNYESTYLEDYITVQNADLGAPQSFSDTEYSNYYSMPALDATSSMVYKFKFTCADNTYVTIRDTAKGWNGYQVIFLQAGAVQFYRDGACSEQYTLYDAFSSSSECTVEFGAIDIKNSDNLILFVKIDGSYKLYEIVGKRASDKYSNDMCGIGVWGAASAFAQVDDEKVSYDYVENYDTLYNCDWTVDTKNAMSDEWTPAVNDKSSHLLSFAPNSSNVTASFVWKFKYTPKVDGTVAIYVLSNDGWDPSKAGTISLNSWCPTVDAEYSVELRVKKIKDHDRYHIALIVDDDRKESFTANRVNDTCTGIGVYAPAGQGAFKAENYKYEIMSNDGTSSLAGGTLATNAAPTYDKESALTTSEQVFIGYEYSGKLYKTLADAFEDRTAGIFTAKAKTVSLQFLGAALKTNLNGTAATIKFAAQISSADAASTYIKDYGMIFTTTETIGETFTHAALENAAYFHDIKNSDNMNKKEENGAIGYYIYLESISLSNYGVEFSSRPYVKVEYEGGATEYVYAPYTTQSGSRSVYSVAKMAIDGGKETAATMELCQKYTNGVVELDSGNQLVDVTNTDYQRDYTAEVSVNDSVYTITLTAKAGTNFDFTNVGSVYLGGERMTVEKATDNADGTATIVCKKKQQ